MGQAEGILVLLRRLIFNWFWILVVVSLPLWCVVAIAAPDSQLTHRLFDTTFFQVVSHDYSILGTHFLTAGGLWFNANFDVAMAYPLVLTSKEVWSIWLYWFAHFAGYMFVAYIVLWLASRLARLVEVWQRSRGVVEQNDAFPFVWWVEPMKAFIDAVTGSDLHGLSVYDSAWKRGSRMIGMGLLIIALSLLGAVVVASHHSRLALAFPLGLGLLGFIVIGQGQQHHNAASNAKRQDEIEARNHGWSLQDIEYSRITRPRWELDKDADVQTQQRTHEAGLAIMQYEHQRLMLLSRQPHELRMQAMTLPASLMLILGQIRAEDKIGQFEALINRTQAAVNRVVEDAQNSTTDTTAAQSRAQTAAEFLLELVEAWAKRI